MGIFDWLTGKDIVQNKNCYFEKLQDDTKRGKWVYTCKVNCPESSVSQIVRCFTEDIETRPIYKCSCGESFKLFSAPYKVYMGKDKIVFYHTGSLLCLRTGKWGRHKVVIDKIIECEQDW